jgi:hypothetical protein
MVASLPKFLTRSHVLCCFQGASQCATLNDAPLEGPVYTHHHWREDSQDDLAAERQTASLAAVVVILLLLVSGLFLVQQLRAATKLEDCLLSGRRDCDTFIVYQH